MKYSTNDFYMLGSRRSNWLLKPITKIKSIYSQLQFAWGCLKVIQNPFDTDTVIRSAIGLATPERFKNTLELLNSLDGGKEIIRDKVLLTQFKLDSLILLPKETLGYVYAEHMKKNNLDPDFYNVEFNDDISYIFYRYGKLHDILHIITGFDTTIPSEIGILAYTYAQSKGPGAILISALALIHGVLKKPQELNSYVESFVKGWHLGKNSKPYFTVDWDRAMSRPLVDIQREMNLI